jgi:inorganic pyrophosphatase
MIDNGEADDKIIAVLENDLFWGNCNDIGELPDKMIERLSHYFSTYKMVPGQSQPPNVSLVYDKAHALKVVTAAIEDYKAEIEG